MWQSSYGTTKLVKHYTPGRTAQSSGGLTLQRVAAELKVGGLVSAADEIVLARAFLSDFRAEWIGLFSSRPLSTGTEIALRLESPRSFYCAGRVASCVLVPRLTHIISTVRYDYRIAVRFVFGNPEERIWVRQFAAEVSGAPAWKISDRIRTEAQALMKAFVEPVPAGEPIKEEIDLAIAA